MKLANLTMHDQTSLVGEFAALGYEINPTPLLREVSGAEDAIKAAQEALATAKLQGVEGILLGGRTDVCIYAAILATIGGLKVFVAETERIRDENDRFVFRLSGVVSVQLASVSDSYYGPGAQVEGVRAYERYK